MAILVTGGAGYIGSHMVLALVERGEEVVVLDNLSTGMWWAVPPEAKLVEGDIGDEALLDRMMSEHTFDAIVHFAGSIVVPDSVSDPLGYYLNNTVKSRMLMACAVKAGIPRFIFSSTAAVYGNPATQPVFEDAAPAPISPYGSSKLMTEWMLKDAHVAHGLQYIALRYFNVAGADPEAELGEQHRPETHLIPLMLDAIEGRRPALTVFGADYPTPDGTCVRDYVHVMDLVDAHVRGLRWLLDGRGNRAFNLGSGRGFSVREVIEASRAVTNRAVPVIEGPRRPGDAAALVSGSVRAMTELGWTPTRSTLPQMIRDALNWAQKPGFTQ